MMMLLVILAAVCGIHGGVVEVVFWVSLKQIGTLISHRLFAFYAS